MFACTGTALWSEPPSTASWRSRGWESSGSFSVGPYGSVLHLSTRPPHAHAIYHIVPCCTPVLAFGELHIEALQPFIELPDRLLLGHAPIALAIVRRGCPPRPPPTALAGSALGHLRQFCIGHRLGCGRPPSANLYFLTFGFAFSISLIVSATRTLHSGDFLSPHFFQSYPTSFPTKKSGGTRTPSRAPARHFHASCFKTTTSSHTRMFGRYEEVRFW
jgi:hypothetical protein